MQVSINSANYSQYAWMYFLGHALLCYLGYLGIYLLFKKYDKTSGIVERNFISLIGIIIIQGILLFILLKLLPVQISSGYSSEAGVATGLIYFVYLGYVIGVSFLIFIIRLLFDLTKKNKIASSRLR